MIGTVVTTYPCRLPWLGRPPSPGIKPVPSPVIRSDFRRAGQAFIARPLRNPAATTQIKPLLWLLFRSDFRRAGQVIITRPIRYPPATTVVKPPSAFVLAPSFRRAGQALITRPIRNPAATTIIKPASALIIAPSFRRAGIANRFSPPLMPARINIAGKLPLNVFYRSDFRRAGQAFIARPLRNPAATTQIRPLPAALVRSDFRRLGQIFFMRLIRNPASITTNPPPSAFVFSQSFRRAGLIDRIIPPLVRTIPPVAGKLPVRVLYRSDFRRAGQVVVTRVSHNPPSTAIIKPLSAVLVRSDFRRTGQAVFTRPIRNPFSTTIIRPSNPILFVATFRRGGLVARNFLLTDRMPGKVKFHLIYRPDARKAGQVMWVRPLLIFSSLVTRISLPAIRQSYGTSQAYATITVTSNSGIPTGTVTLSFNGAVINTVNLVNGYATITINTQTLPYGDYQMIATYTPTPLTIWYSVTASSTLTILTPSAADVPFIF